MLGAKGARDRRDNGTGEAGPLVEKHRFGLPSGADEVYGMIDDDVIGIRGAVAGSQGRISKGL